MSLRLKSSFSVGSTLVGDTHPAYVIAEAGSNHDGKLSQALQLIDVAAEARADAVKFQVFSAETIVSKADLDISRLGDKPSDNLYQLYKKAEMPREWLPELYAYCVEKNIEFLATPFDENAVDQLEALGVAAYKIASFELNHFPLLRHVAGTGKPVLLSTGMATLEEVKESLECLYEAGADQVGVFHCGISYPMPLNEVNLNAMKTLHDAFNCPVGYSDHTLGITVPVAAVACGGKLLEKHYTLRKDLDGPDHNFSLDPEELKAMVQAVRQTEAAMGSFEKAPTPCEMLHRRRGRRSLFAKQNIAEGTTVTTDMIAVLRPGTGLHPREMDQLIGSRAVQDIAEGMPLTWDVLSPNS